LEKAVASLGKLLTVRQDGKGDFRSIQAAIDSAQPNSLIEIGDNGPYGEQIRISKEKVKV
jgi:pectin methylesterase-like acyl-CoA thioesterase